MIKMFGKIYFDKEKLEQILINFLDTSIEQANEKGIVTLIIDLLPEKREDKDSQLGKLMQEVLDVDSVINIKDY